MTKKQSAKFHLLLAHGAGAGKDSEWMKEMSQAIEENGIKVIRFDFPYMEKRAIDGKRRPPDRMPKLIDAFKSEIEKLGIKPNQLIIGGKSMGGRVASLLVSELSKDELPAGIICLGFPFAPPGKPENFRGEHLESIKLPTLILQGERDNFGGAEMINKVKFSKKVECVILKDGDHSFKPRVKSGLTQANNIETASQAIASFVDSI